MTATNPDQHGDPEEVRQAVADAMERRSDLRNKARSVVNGLFLRKMAEKAWEDRERAAESEKAAAAVESLWLDRDALDNLPGAVPLIDGVLYRSSLVVLAGPPGSYKSFVAISWAASVATGSMWLNHAATQGRAVYLAGEGEVGFPNRLLAWEIANHDGRRVPLDLYPRPAALHKAEDPATAALVDSIVSRRPDLVIVDTLHRYSGGMNENSAEEMGLLVKVLSTIKDETGACVVVVHHTGKDGSSERGSNSLRGASDALFMLDDLRASKRTVTLVADRHKERESGGKTPLALEVVNTPRGSSLVVPRVPDPFTREAPPEPPAEMPTPLSPNLTKVLWVMYVHTAGTLNGHTEAQIRALVKDSPLHLGRSERQRWSDAWKRATKDGLVVPVSGSSRWGLDMDRVQEEFGFSSAAETYYRRLHDLEEDDDV